MTSGNKFVVLVILSVFGSCKSLVQLPSVEENDIWRTEVAIRTTVNNLFSLLQLKGSTGKSKIKQYTTVHNSFVSQTLQDYDTLKEIAKLTRVDKNTLQNVTTNFIDALNDVINDENFYKLTKTMMSLNNLEDEIHNLQYMKEFYASPKYYSGINIDLLKILESKDEIIITIPNEGNVTKAENTKEEKTFDKLLEGSDTWKPKHAAKESRRLYKGEYAQEKHFPFMASIEIFKKFHCGASVIKSDLLLTAASCLQLAWNNRYYRENPLFLQVRVGSQYYEVGGEAIAVLEIYFHPQYAPKTLENNIAVIRTVRHINLHDRKVTKVKRIELDTSEHNMPQNVEILILGWGAYSVNNMGHIPVDGQLRKYFLPVYGLPECQEIYTKKYVTQTNFCAGFASKGTGGACNRDAGGPGVLNGYLVGIVSFGSPICGSPDTPTVFTKVGYYYDWIEYIMEQNVPTAKKYLTMKPKSSSFDFNIIHPDTTPNNIIYFPDSYTTETNTVISNESVSTTTEFCLTPITEELDECVIREGGKCKRPQTKMKTEHPKYIIHDGVKYKMISDSKEFSQDNVSYTFTPKQKYYDDDEDDSMLVQSYTTVDIYKPTQTTTKISTYHYSPDYMKETTTEEPAFGDLNFIDSFIDNKIPRSKVNNKQLKLFKQFIRSIFDSKNDVEEFINLLTVTKAHIKEVDKSEKSLSTTSIKTTKAKLTTIKSDLDKLGRTNVMYFDFKRPAYTNKDVNVYLEDNSKYYDEEPYGMEIPLFVQDTTHWELHEKSKKTNEINKSKTKQVVTTERKDKSYTTKPDKLYKAEVVSVEMLSDSQENVINASKTEKQESISDSDFTHDIYKTLIKSYGKQDTSRELSIQALQKPVVSAKINDKDIVRWNKIYESEVQGSKILFESGREKTEKHSRDSKKTYVKDKLRLKTPSDLQDKETTKTLFKMDNSDVSDSKLYQDKTQISEETVQSNEVDIIVPKEDIGYNRDDYNYLEVLNESYVKDQSVTSSKSKEIELNKSDNQSVEYGEIVGEIYEENVYKLKEPVMGNDTDSSNSDNQVYEELSSSDILTENFPIEAQMSKTRLNSFREYLNKGITIQPDRKDFKKAKKYVERIPQKKPSKPNEQTPLEFDLDFASLIQSFITNTTYEPKTTKKEQKKTRIKDSALKIKKNNHSKEITKTMRLFQLKTAFPSTENITSANESSGKLYKYAENDNSIPLFKTITEKYKALSRKNISIMPFHTELNRENKENEKKYKVQDEKINRTNVTPSTKANKSSLIENRSQNSTKKNLVSKNFNNSSIPLFKTTLKTSTKNLKNNIPKATSLLFKVQLGDKNKQNDTRKTLTSLDSKKLLKTNSKTSILTTLMKNSAKNDKKTTPTKTKTSQNTSKNKSAENIQTTLTPFRIHVTELNKIQKNQTNKI